MLRWLVNWWSRTAKQNAADLGLANGNAPDAGFAVAEDARLQAFVEDFLAPIAADGKLNLKFEQTPLLAAFYAYGIDDLLCRDKAGVERRFRDTIRDAAAKGVSPEAASNLVPAWSRISKQTARISRGEFEKLRTWFREEAAKPRVVHPFDEQPTESAFSKSAIGVQAIKVFYCLFREMGLAVDEDNEAATVVSTSTDGQVITQQFDQAFLDGLANWVKDQSLHMREQEILDSFEKLLAGEGLPGMAFDEHRSGSADQAVRVPNGALASDANLWFLGDIHGDLLALECAVRYIQGYRSAQPYTLVLLGDLFDDGGFGYEVLLRVFDLITKKPGSIALLAGNHDEAFGYGGACFTSSVSPSDFTDWLNQRADDGCKRRAGELAIKYFRSAPRALFLPDGLLVVHGGIPHSGRWDSIKQPTDLNSEECLQDFVWMRAHKRPVRIPDYTTRGCEFGYEDFANFCKLATKVIGQPVARMVRGHDHIEERYLVHPTYQSNPVLTINAMARRLPREPFGSYERTPCVARWVSGQLPEVHRLVIPAEVIRDVYPEAQA